MKCGNFHRDRQREREREMGGAVFFLSSSLQFINEVNVFNQRKVATL